MDDAQILLAMAGMAVAIIIPFVGWLLRIDRRSARLLKEAEDARAVHERIERKADAALRESADTKNGLHEVKGELKRINGKH